MIDQHINGQLRALAINLEAEGAEVDELSAQHNAVADQVQKLQKRIAEQRAKAVKAVSDYRAGVIDVGVAGIIQKAADLDISDLETLLAPEIARLAELDAALRKATGVLNRSQKAFTETEVKIACDAFDLQIKAIERKLCEALVERYNMQHRAQNSLWDIWTPSHDLKEAVDMQALPRLR